LYIDKNNITQAKSILLETLADIKSTQYAPVIAKYYALLSKLYFLDNNLSDSEYYAKKAIDKATGAGNSKPIIIAYYYLYKIYKNLNSDKEALSYYIKYSEAQNAHLKGEKAKNLAFQLAEHKSLEQETQIKLLNEKNNALAAEQALAKTQATNKKLIILSLTLIIFVFAFLGLRFYHAHKRVKGLAEYDPLTGAFNRGHFNHVAEDALQYCKNTRQDLSLIVFDLDHFKNVNDTFGHGCGDWALKETIKVCKEIGRKNDIFARLGGEEFCIVLPGCNIEAARLHAEACRAAIEAIDTKESTHEFHITASFGVTDVKLSGFNLDILLANADMAAYASKNSGRNLVTLHQAS
jgi:diguanylate cyclase (GGDEF)-like protein